MAHVWRRNGDKVYVTTRSPERATRLTAEGFIPIILDITDFGSLAELSQHQFATVVVSVGMDRTASDSVHHVYVNGLKNVLSALPQPNSANVTPHLVYVSSTGVYGDFGGDWVDEQSPTDPQRDGGKACLAAEDLLKNSEFWNSSTILRMAGLYGGSRVPTLQKVKKKVWTQLSPAGYLNLIHMDDAVAAINAVVTEKLTAEVFCVSDGNPSIRRDYYQFIADHFGLGPIDWSDEGAPDKNARSSSSKRIGNRKLLDATGLQLSHPDYRSGLAECFAATSE